MKWKKIGKIFDPREHRLPNNCVEYAQSPQTLIFHNFVRIYFSTRERDKTGKYLSHVAYVDMDRRFRIINVSKKTVIPLGEKGCFDEHGIFPFHIFKGKDKIFGYIGGWSRRISVPIETSIGVSESKDDGLTFTRTGNGPILTSSLHEPFLVGDPFVQYYSGVFHLWYIYGTKWIDYPKDKEPQRVYKIGHAVSKNGITWEKEGRQIIPDVIGPLECQALPSVIKQKKMYHMIFCFRYATDFRKSKNRSYRLGYAHSTNLNNWTRDDLRAGITVSKDGWDSDMRCYPHLFRWNGNAYLLYNGNEFGRFGFGLAVLEGL